MNDIKSETHFLYCVNEICERSYCVDRRMTRNYIGQLERRLDDALSENSKLYLTIEALKEEKKKK